MLTKNGVEKRHGLNEASGVTLRGVQAVRKKDPLPAVEAVDALPLKTLPAFLAQLAALQTRAAARLHSVGTERDEDDLACLDVNEVARLLKCSVDLVRERG